MASPLLILLILVPLALGHKDHKCKEEFKKVYAAVGEIIKNGEAPSCYSELELKRFQPQDPDDREQHKEMHKKLREWLKEQPEDKQNAVKECKKELKGMALEKITDISEECREEIKKKMEKKRG